MPISKCAEDSASPMRLTYEEVKHFQDDLTRYTHVMKELMDEIEAKDAEIQEMNEAILSYMSEA